MRHGLPDRLPAGDFPEAGRAGLTAGQQRLPVRAEAHLVDRGAAVVRQALADLFATGKVPYLDRTAARQEGLAVRGEGDVLDPAARPHQAERPARGRVPEPDGAVVTARHGDLPVGA